MPRVKAVPKRMAQPTVRRKRSRDRVQRVLQQLEPLYGSKPELLNMVKTLGAELDCLRVAASRSTAHRARAWQAIAEVAGVLKASDKLAQRVLQVGNLTCGWVAVAFKELRGRNTKDHHVKHALVVLDKAVKLSATFREHLPSKHRELEEDLLFWLECDETAAGATLLAGACLMDADMEERFQTTVARGLLRAGMERGVELALHVVASAAGEHDVVQRDVVLPALQTCVLPAIQKEEDFAHLGGLLQVYTAGSAAAVRADISEFVGLWCRCAEAALSEVEASKPAQKCLQHLCLLFSNRLVQKAATGLVKCGKVVPVVARVLTSKTCDADVQFEAVHVLVALLTPAARGHRRCVALQLGSTATELGHVMARLQRLEVEPGSQHSDCCFQCLEALASCWYGLWLPPLPEDLEGWPCATSRAGHRFRGSPTDFRDFLHRGQLIDIANDGNAECAAFVRRWFGVV